MNIDRAGEIGEALMVNENTDQHGKRGERGCGKRSHQLVRGNHYSRSYQMNSQVLPLISLPTSLLSQ